jgi:glycosyltransferase involved in cell wall biosynthesis
VDRAFRPPCSTRHLELLLRAPRFCDKLRRDAPTLASAINSILIGRLFDRMNTSVVLAAYPYQDFTVAAFLAARKRKLPFYVHMHDLWLENLPPGKAGAAFAAKWEAVILRQAARVLCMTEAMQEYYLAKYGIATDLLPHTISEQDLAKAPQEMRSPSPARTTVLFVGAVSQPMNLDALRTLASASELFPEGWDLLFCTSKDLPSLARLGIQSSRLQARYVSRAEVQRLQSESHVLIAPLSHKNACMEEVRTVFSTKLLEYLVAGRPIVVFAPKDSFHARSAGKGGWAYTVEEDSPRALAEAIFKVATEPDLGRRLVNGALAEARSRVAGTHAERLRCWVIADSEQKHPFRQALHLGSSQPESVRK